MSQITPPGPPMEEPEPSNEPTGYLPPLPGNPYAPPPANPYGPPETKADGRPSFDGISLAALICSLTCCAGVVGVGLGIAGIVRTSGKRRRGRWAAMLGIILGVIGTGVVVAALVGLGWLGVHVRDASDLETGDCVDFLVDDDTDALLTADCDGPHDAQVVHQGQFTDKLLARYRNGTSVTFCQGWLKGGAHPFRLGGSLSDYYLGVTHEGTDVGDDFACLIWRQDGDKLQEDARW